ncbi:MAG: hypothetical protein JWQ90_5433 [Hydrocarboniphaga sp.]|uniref:hypothetical protein n=1 Tax=Hydrocarboniphaga sp. TaxID=2033016 RepID=UPI00260C4124|nr:hypothetical protein [Hydrocarboniphaga sp.]MDB5972983.1 hypothetical protein [Hydrocarboniphaga sp.]
MDFNKTACVLALSALIAAPAYAQSSTAADVQRDANQEQRIDNGLQSGQLNTREAGQLQHEEAHVDQMEQKADHNGSVSAHEQSEINAEQNKLSRNINNAKHNSVTGNPDSKSSKRMQADVQQDASEQQRIANGMQNGSLSNRETGRLERGQAHDDRAQSTAAANGHVSASEQQNQQQRDKHQSNQIHKDKHDNDYHG